MRTRYNTLVIPIRIGFNQLATGWVAGLELFMDWFFICDFFLNWNIGYAEGGVVVTAIAAGTAMNTSPPVWPSASD